MKQKQEKRQAKTLENPSTSDSLSDVIIPSSQIYYSQPEGNNHEYLHETTILQFTLSHCNLQWLQKQLKSVQIEGAQKFRNNQRRVMAKNDEDEEPYLTGFPTKGVQFFHSQLVAVEGNISSSIAKIKATRSVLMKKLPEKLLKTSATFNQKHNKKMNILKSLQVLNNLKQIKKNLSHTQTEEQIEEYREKYKASGVVVITELLQNSLTRSANKFIINSLPYKIRHYRNLASVMEDQFDVAECHYSKLREVNQQLYHLFKKYAVLSKSLVYKGENNSMNQLNQIDQICQSRISEFMSRNDAYISRHQYEKTESLAQCNNVMAEFFNRESQKLKDETISYLRNAIKELSSFSQLKYLSSLTQESFQHNLADQFKNIENRSFLFSKSSSLTMKLSLLVSYFNLLFVPLLNYLMLIATRMNPNDSHKNRRYQKARIMQLYFVRYSQILDHCLEMLGLHEKQIEEWGCLFYKATLLMKINQEKCQEEQLSQFFSQKGRKLSEQEKSQSIIFFSLNLNNYFGQSLLFLACKLQNLLAQRESDRKSDISKQIHSLWIDMVSESLVFHILFHKDEVNLLSHLKFLNAQIAERASQMCEAYSEDVFSLLPRVIKIRETRLMRKDEKERQKKIPKGKQKSKGLKWNIFAKTSRLQSEQKISDDNDTEEKQKCYGKLMELNLKTMKYIEVMEMAQVLQVSSELQKMHKDLYYYFKKNPKQ